MISYDCMCNVTRVRRDNDDDDVWLCGPWLGNDDDRYHHSLYA